MLKRRDFIKQGVALAAVAPVPMAASSRPAPFQRRAIDVVLVDRRYADSRAFAQALQSQGARVIDNSEDLGALWYGEFGAAYAATPLRFAGLTPHSDLFICEAFARERGAWVAYRGAHDCRGLAALTHSLELSTPLVGLAAQLDGAGSRWPTRLAQQLSRASRDYPPKRWELVATRAARAPDHPGTLFSWLLS